MRYKRIAATRYGGPEVLEMVEEDLRAPAAGEARIKVLAASVSRVDVTARQGRAFYSGTPLGQKVPFVPGYAVVGTVDAVGPGVREVRAGDRVGVLTVIGGYSQYIYWKSNRLVPVPAAVDPAQAVTLMLNYIVAYQTLHRSAKVRPGEKMLVIGASGGIGTALLELGRLANLNLYGLASAHKQDLLAGLGAKAIDYHTQDFVEVIRQAEPDGIDVVLDGVTSMDTIRGGLSLLRRGGRLVCFGEPAGVRQLPSILARMLAVRLQPGGKSMKLYGTSTYFLGDKKPYLEDWAVLFDWLETGKIQPVIMQRFPILEAAQANALLESGQVCGNLVLVAPDEI